MSDIDPEDELDDEGLSVEDVMNPTRALSELPEIMHTKIELEKIPHALWEQTLAVVPTHQRGTVANHVGDRHLRQIAWALISKLAAEVAERRNEQDRAHHRARRTGYPLPMPTPSHAVARQTVQVNIRLRGDDHQRLTDAADVVGLKPTTLARALVLNGAGRILQEHAR
ncbi:hypothetical protein BH20ACT16_BH20ACT16_06610 [soil metagenome]